MPKNNNKSLVLTEFKHQSICNEFDYLIRAGYALNMVMNMVSWKHLMSPESAYNIYKKYNSEISPERPL
jgi:hypothetical protein